VYSELHSTRTAQHAVFEIEQWVSRIERILPDTQPVQRATLYRTLWHFHDLMARIYSDNLDWTPTFDHLNAAMNVANLLDSNELRMVSLYRSGTTRMDQRNFLAAKSDMDGAVKYAQFVSDPSIKGAVFSAAGLAYALVETDGTAITVAQRFLDQAEHYAGEVQVSDSYDIRFNLAMYFRERADTLLSLGRPGKALAILDEAEELQDPSYKRRSAYLDILRAEAYTRLKRPEFDTAVTLLSDALETSKTIQSAYCIGYIRRIYAVLAASSYGTSPVVADLGMSLRELRSSK
jgi:tetratricopeptide (TPR) repeat protein